MNDNIERLNNQAITLAQKGDFEMAIACFKKAIEIEKTNAFLWYNLGCTYRDCGKTQDAFEAFLQARTLKPEDQETLESLALLAFSCSDNLSAIAFAEEGLSYNQENPRLWNTMGVVNFNVGNFDEAAECFEQALIYSPFYYDALYNLRDTYEELGNNRGVKECEYRMKNLRKNNER